MTYCEHQTTLRKRNINRYKRNPKGEKIEMHSSHLMAAGPSSSFQNHIGCNCLGTYDLKT